MTLLKIARMGHPILKQHAAEVQDPTAPEVRRLVVDMIETMRDANGTGLAAPQVHMPLRVVVFFVNEARAARENAGDEQDSEDLDADSGDDGVPLTVLINPKLEFLSEEQSLGWEGCLSVPGLAGQVPRYTALRYSAFDLEGQRFERVAKGFHARVVQHECDHLDGILYPQRMTDLATLTFTTEIGASSEPPEEGGEAGAEIN